RNFTESLHFAVAGILHAFRTHRNLRTHFALGVLVLLVSFSFELSRSEMAILMLTIGFGVAADLMNTAVQHVVDLLSEGYHVLAMHAKNVAAGAVLTAAVTGVLVGYILFFDRISSLHRAALQRTVTVPSFVILAALVLVVLSVVIAKALSRDFR